ncbi:MAG: protein kinase [Planctomycetota bacterium]
MNDPEENLDPAVLDFIQDFEDDVAEGTDRPLGFYLKRYPEAETQVAAEYLRRRAAADEESARAAAALDGERIGRFRLVGALGQGGQGMVLEAMDERLGRRVALKLLQGRLITETRRRRFQREAEILARIDHHGIAEVLDADFEGDEPYIAMRFVPGTDLAAEIRAAREGRAGVLPIAPSDQAGVQRLLRFFEDAALALDAAHQLGVVHRDVKPGNLMVRPDGEPVVLDFGLATGAEDEALTRAGEGLGTPEYMAPEQIEEGRGELDARTDVYGLGVSLYEALTGTRPFQGSSPHEIQSAILRDTPPAAERVNRALNGSVAAVVAVAMERDPARRYASARDLAEDLRRLRRFEPIMARPPGATVRVRRWAQRQPAVAASLAGVFLAITAALVVALHGIEVRDGLIAEKNEALDLAGSRLYLARAEERLQDNPSAALALAEYANRLHSNAETRSALFAPLLATRLELRLRADDATRIGAVAMSPDGQRIAGVADETAVWFWGVSGDAAERVEVPDDGQPLSAIRWLDADGGVLVGSAGGTVHLLRDGEVVWSSDPGPAVGELHVDPGGDVVHVTSDEGTRALDLGSGAQRWATDSTLGWRTRLVVEADGEASLRTLSVRGDQGPLGLAVPHPAGNITCSAVSADGSRAAIVLQPSRVFAWSTETGAVLLDEVGEFVADSIQWGPAGRRLLVSTESRNAYLWRAEPSVELLPVRASGPPLLIARFVEGGDAALLVDREGRMELIATPREEPGGAAPPAGTRLWSRTSGAELRCASDLTAGGAFGTVGADGRVAIWQVDADASTVSETGSLDLGRAVDEVLISPDGAALLLMAPDGRSAALEAASMTLKEVEGGASSTARCALPGGVFAFGQGDGGILLSDGRSLPAPFDDGRQHPVVAMALSPDGARLAACYFPTFVATWDLASGEAVGGRVTVSRADRLSWSADGTRIAVGAPVAGPTFRVIDVEASTVSPRELSREAGPRVATFVPGADQVVVGAENGEVHVFGPESGARLVFPLHGAPLATIAVDAHGDEARALSADADGRVFVWPLNPEAAAARRLAHGVDDWERLWVDGGLRGE